MEIATLTDATSNITDSMTLISIDENIKLFIMIYVLFKCIEMVRIGFTRLYKRKGV